MEKKIDQEQSPWQVLKNIYRPFLSFKMLAFRTLKLPKMVTRDQHDQAQQVVNYDRAGNKAVSGIFEIRFSFKAIGANAKSIG